MTQHREAENRIVELSRLSLRRRGRAECQSRCSLRPRARQAMGDVVRVDVQAFDVGVWKVTSECEDLISPGAAEGQYAQGGPVAELRTREFEQPRIAVRKSVVVRLESPRQGLSEFWDLRRKGTAEHLASRARNLSQPLQIQKPHRSARQAFTPTARTRLPK